MNKNIKINVEYLTRVEGHGNIVVDVKDGNLKPAVWTSWSRRVSLKVCSGDVRFLKPSISPAGSAEFAPAVTPSHRFRQRKTPSVFPTEQTIKLRKLLLDFEMLDSHILHIYLLVAPDLLGVKSFVPLIGSHNEVVRRALRMKKLCNDVCDVLVGRHVHPISATVGGFTKLPKPKDLDAMLEMLKGMRPDMDATVELALTLKFPSFERDSEYVALVSDDSEYPLLMGEIGSTDGVRMSKNYYRKITNEFVVPHSSAKHTKLGRESCAALHGLTSMLKSSTQRLKKQPLPRV